MIDSIIFDMDGTLVNFVKQVKESWNITFKNEGLNKTVEDKDIISIMGLTTLEIGKKFFPSLDEKDAEKIITLACNEEVEYIINNATKKDLFIPNEQFLQKLAKKYRLFIVSNCLSGYIEAFYQISGYKKYFVDFLNHGNGKEKHENILEIKRKYNLIDPVYIGDTLKDYNACLKANVKFIYAAYGYGKVNCSNKINDIREIEKEIKNFEK